MQKLLQLLAVADGELKVEGDDPLLLVVHGSVAGKHGDLCGQLIHDGGQVDACSAAGVVTSFQKMMDPSKRRLETCPHRPGD